MVFVCILKQVQEASNVCEETLIADLQLQGEKKEHLIYVVIKQEIHTEKLEEEHKL